MIKKMVHELFLLIALFVTVACLFWAMLPPAERLRDVDHGFFDRVLPGPENRPVRYVVFVPPEAAIGQPLPLIVSLNDFGENGFDGRLPLKVGLGPAVWDLYQRRRPLPAYVLFPQARKGWLSPGEDWEMLFQQIDAVRKSTLIDERRIYLTGTLNGGSGVWALAMQHPDLWAAIVPMSGRLPKGDLTRLKGIAIWAFHNSEDNPEPLRNAVRKLTDMGGNARITEYDQPGYDSWSRGYSDEALFRWLFRQSGVGTLNNTKY